MPITRAQFLKRLRPLLITRSPFGQEEQIAQQLHELLENGLHLNVKEDKLHNLMATREINGKPPQLILNAHLDTIIEGEDDEDARASTTEQINAHFDQLLKYENQDRIHIEGTHLGLDDKVGVALILWLLDSDKLKDISLKILFTVQEEHSQNGARQIPDTFFENVKYVFSLDRMNYGELITEYQQRQICDKGFLEKIISWGKTFDLKKASGGTRADALPIAYKSLNKEIYDHYELYKLSPDRRVDCINFSVGMYKDHEINDYCIISEAMKIGNAIEHIILQLNP